MLLAAQHGFFNIILFFESPQYPLKFQNGFGDSLLHYACKGSQLKMVHYLLMKQVSPMMTNKFNETPLFAAAEVGSAEIVQRLCKERANQVDHQDKFGDTALHFASRDGQLEVCEVLIKKLKRLLKIKN